MNKSLIIGLIIGAVVVTAGGAIAMRAHGDRYADVLDVKPVTKTVSTPRQVCEDQVVTRQKPVKDEHQVTGTVIGAVVGGVLGHQVGGGRGKDVATVAGAAAGGYAGNKIQERAQEGNTYQTTEQQCRTVYDSKQETVGYDVRYRLKDKESVVRMDHDPGDRIPVKGGALDVTSSS
ncbi:MAG TPA: glycine zipper 2TM domain-containing protein [Steroidobacteraceae bacterium]|nr:glycine zipper 2TM domain-containing protein [Steroidobacteraceae bacterium]